MWLLPMMLACGFIGGDETPDDRGKRKKGKRTQKEAPAPAPTNSVVYGEMMDGWCSLCNTGTMPKIEVKSSSALKEGSQTYSAMSVLDDDAATAWCEGSDGTGVGESLTFSFSKKVSIEAIVFQGGYFKSAGSLRDNGRVKRARIQIDGGKSKEVTLSDPTQPGSVSRTNGKSWLEQITQDPAIILLDFPEETTTRSLTFTILETYEGAKHPDTCISGMDINLVDPNWLN